MVSVVGGSQVLLLSFMNESDGWALALARTRTRPAVAANNHHGHLHRHLHLELHLPGLGMRLVRLVLVAGLVLWCLGLCDILLCWAASHAQPAGWWLLALVGVSCVTIILGPAFNTSTTTRVSNIVNIVNRVRHQHTSTSYNKV